MINYLPLYMNRMEIGALFKEVRKEQGLTQADLAKKVQSHTQNISRLEKGAQNVTWDLITKVAKALKREAILVLKPE